MSARLIGAAALVVATTPLLVATAPTVVAAEACTPSITMAKPTMVGGFDSYTVSYVTCDSPLLITLKFQQKGTPDKNIWSGYWHISVGPNSAGQETRRHGCIPDGLAHRWIAIATLRTPDKKTVVAKTPKTFFKTTPTTSCTL